ncbi:MAG: hypothetical protein K6F39_04175 [Lachnospiraceae bacterium]|nr:hypothetical protein [Lachnospiraceae bacterium]
MNLKKYGKLFTGREGFWPVFLITMLIACLPLFTVNCINGHDVIYHLLRIEALAEGIREGLPFLRVNVLFFGGEGYASSMFYPDTLTYIPAILRAAGVGINLSYHIFVALTIILGFLSAYFCTKMITEKRQSALIAAVIFTLCQYHIEDIYTRSAVGEFTAMIFIPFVIYGLWDFMYKECEKPWFLGIGMTGVVLCHTLTTVFCVGLCVLAVLISIKKIIAKPVMLMRLFLTAIIVLMLTAYYWIPMIEQMSSQVLKYTQDSFDLNYEKLLLRNVFGSAYNNAGWAVFAAVLPRVFIKRKSDIIKFADMCMVMGLLFALCTTGFFPWARLARFLGFIQFPWRLFIAASPLLAVAGGIYICEFVKRSNLSSEIAIMAVLITMAISAIGNFESNDQGYYSYSGDYFSYAPYTAEVIGGEWLPVNAERNKLVKDAGVAYTDNDSEIEVKRERNELRVVSDGSEKYLDVPFVYYKGYAAEDSKGNELQISGDGENGRVRVHTQGAGEIRVFYKGTTLQLLSTAVSAAVMILLIFAVLYQSRCKSNLLILKGNK